MGVYLVEDQVFAVISKVDLDEILWIMYQMYMPLHSLPSVRGLFVRWLC
jgi:hypothetical protein